MCIWSYDKLSNRCNQIFHTETSLSSSTIHTLSLVADSLTQETKNVEAPINSENNTVNETTAKVAQRNEVNYCYTLCGGIASPLYIFTFFAYLPRFIPLANLNTGEYNYYTGSCCKIGEWANPSLDFHCIIASYISLHLSIHNYKHVFQISYDAFLLDGQYC